MANVFVSARGHITTPSLDWVKYNVKRALIKMKIVFSTFFDNGDV